MKRIVIEPGTRPHPESRLTAIGPAPSRGTASKPRSITTFRCDCGSVVEIDTWTARRGLSRSCGCLRRESTSRARSHGLTNTPLYLAWRSMRNRCQPVFQSKHPSYLGVTCASEWLSFEGFINSQPAGRPFAPGLVLARHGDVGDYTPSNCRWATPHENTRELVERIALRLPDGRLVGDAARVNGIPPRCAVRRIRSGWNPLDAVSIPVQTKFRKKTAA